MIDTNRHGQAAAVTMVKDDYFFFEKWVNYYGEMFGRGALYVINHGGNPRIDDLGEGCNIMHIPDHFDESFDRKRWRLLQNLANGLIYYYPHVFVGDVDEYVVLDPKLGLSLTEFLAKRRKRSVITPIGLEVVHRPEEENEELSGTVLGPRKYCRYSTYFCKPCVLGKQTKIGRGGHYASDSELTIFKNLYLFHLKYCDKTLFEETRKGRERQTDALFDGTSRKTNLSSDWYAARPGELNKYQQLASLPVSENFSFKNQIQNMKETWGPRGETDLWCFEKHMSETLVEIPDRFFGVI